MNEKGFTLVELLGVIVILSIIMLIAIPNVTSVLDRTKKDRYIADSKKFVSIVQYQLRRDNIQKPALGKSVKILLKDIAEDATDEISHDSDGYGYDVQKSYVKIANEDGYLVYYVQLLAITNNSQKRYRGIKEVNVEELDGDNRYQYYENSIAR